MCLYGQTLGDGAQAFLLFAKGRRRAGGCTLSLVEELTGTQSACYVSLLTGDMTDAVEQLLVLLVRMRYLGERREYLLLFLLE